MIEGQIDGDTFGNIFLYFVLGIFIVALICGIIYAIKDRKRRKNIALNNVFLQEKKEELVKYISDSISFRKPYFISAIITIFFLIASVSLFIYYVYKGSLISFAMFLLMILSLIILMYIQNEYKRIFRRKVLRNVIVSYNPTLEYFPENGFGKGEYDNCRFYEDCDILFSDDTIVEKEGSFRYADINAQCETEDSDGHSHYSTVYTGSLARLDIENTNCEIYLGKVKKDIFSKTYKSIKFENEEFNKMFSAYTNNELVAYKLLTPDIMEQFIELKQKTYGKIDVRILNDKLYIRFQSGDSFSPELLNKKLEIDNVISSLAVLQVVMDTMYKVKEIIEKKNL